MTFVPQGRPAIAVGGGRLAVGSPRPNTGLDGVLHLVTFDGGLRELVRNTAALPPREFGARLACNFECGLIAATFTQFDGGGIELRVADGGLHAALVRGASTVQCGQSVALASQALVAATGCGGSNEVVSSEVRVLRPDGGTTTAFSFGKVYTHDVALNGPGTFLATTTCNPDGGACVAEVLGNVLGNITSPIYRSPPLPAADSVTYSNVELDESGSVLAVSNPRWHGGFGGFKVLTFSGTTFDVEAEVDGGSATDQLGFGLAMSGDGRLIVVTRFRGGTTFVYDRFSDGGLCLAQTLPVSSVVRSDVSVSRDGRTIAVVGLDGGLQVYQRP
ncbi:MAG: hypothetical protein IAE78_31015 [Myxococcus sp.]|nr:hypothetical protein [Myxococcus sp.]